jgi:large subunit ribosomal protein L3
MANEISHTPQKRRKALLGKKLGMTQIFTEDGHWVPVTVLEVGPCAVLQVKTTDTDGYAAVQLGFGDRRKRAKRPQQAVYDRVGTKQKRFVREVPFIDPADVVSAAPVAKTEGDASGESEPSVKPGAIVGVAAFKDTRRVDVRGVSKGRGFAGTIKRHHFNAGPKAHGSKNIREPGSTGMHTDPGRVLRGKRMPGHMGAVNRKARNLAVVRLDETRNLLMVEGAVPGPNGGFVYVEESLRQK